MEDYAYVISGGCRRTVSFRLERIATADKSRNTRGVRNTRSDRARPTCCYVATRRRCARQTKATFAQS